VRASRAILVLTTLAVGSAAAISHAQATRVSLLLLATAGDYPGETYTDGPLAPAEFVYFVGERIAVDVSVANWGRARSSLDLSDVSRPHALVAGATASLALREPLVSVWRDGIEGSEVVSSPPPFEVEPGDAVRWRFMLESGLAVPGMYTVEGWLDAVDQHGDAIRRQRPRFTIEVRDRAAAEPAELARREAEWLAASGLGTHAYEATEALARIHPTSVAVHLIRGRLADATGDERGARREMDLAAELLRKDADTLFRRFSRPGQLEDLVDSLRP